MPEYDGKRNLASDHSQKRDFIFQIIEHPKSTFNIQHKNNVRKKYRADKTFEQCHIHGINVIDKQRTRVPHLKDVTYGDIRLEIGISVNYFWSTN